MANLTVSQIILDAQRMANRVKDLDALGNALLVEAEGNNRQLDSMRQFQDDMDSLNRLSRDKSNSDMINRINQQNPSIREIRQENRELKAYLEDHQRTLEIVMQKYREQMQAKILNSPINFKEMFNENYSHVIKVQSEKINEMAAIMQKAASIDDNTILNEIQTISKLRMENETLRELLQISNQFGSAQIANRNLLVSEDKAVQTELDDSKNESIVEKSEDEICFDCSQDSQISKSPEVVPQQSASVQETTTTQRTTTDTIDNNNIEVDHSNNNSLSNGEVTSTTVTEENTHQQSTSLT